ncbi:CLUMA_CG010124, isoform A [Clunio marinus]|uniref:CLUMA_CG010124, isoform A n=1 Tax=Clunio marinus TaxID=568069 RepID=A0A1J1I9W3_9DIPT|nr:CLUMA_CG010124, isoform A [Clunio marinus]
MKADSWLEFKNSELFFSMNNFHENSINRRLLSGNPKFLCGEIQPNELVHVEQEILFEANRKNMTTEILHNFPVRVTRKNL